MDDHRLQHFLIFVWPHAGNFSKAPQELINHGLKGREKIQPVITLIKRNESIYLLRHILRLDKFKLIFVQEWPQAGLGL